MSLLPRLLPLLAALLLGGCETLPHLADTGPVRIPQNVRGPEAWPPEIIRVAVLPAHDASGRLPARFVVTYDNAWQRALAESQRAEFVAISRTVLVGWTGRETFDSTSRLPAGLFARLARETGAQAVLFVELTDVSPYPPLSLAFRTRLADLRTGETLWMADEIFDSRDPATARGARIEARAHATGPGDPTAAIEQSPARFAAHAFRAVAALLPARTPLEIPEKPQADAKPTSERADREQSNGVPSPSTQG
jgi:hypothetical protein